MKSIKIINNLNIVNNGEDCLLESLALFSHIIESKDIDKLINVIMSSTIYSNAGKYLDDYIRIITNICKCGNSQEFYNPIFNRKIHNYCTEFRNIPNFDELNMGSSYIDSIFLSDKAILFNSLNDGNIHIHLIHNISHYFVVVIAGNDIYVLDSIPRLELTFYAKAHNILHFVYPGSNTEIISKLERMSYIKYDAYCSIPSAEDLINSMTNTGISEKELFEFENLFANETSIVQCL